MEEFFQNYGEKIGILLLEILGAVWVYLRTKKKLTPEEKKAKQIEKADAKAEKDYQKAKKSAEKADELKKGGNTQ